jgi:DNA replication and repair protein RecF
MVISQYDAEYLQQLIRYRKALQQRNSLLRAEAEPDPAFIGIYEEEMASSGAVIYDSRRRFVDEFSPIFQSIYQELSGGGETVDLSYQSHVAEHSLRDLLQENRPKDRIMGFTMKGLHRDDLGMLLGGFPIKREGSQGQNKTFVIAMKLAQFDFLKRKGSHRTPILLLDDIFDKLDGQRVEQIVRMVSGNHFGQIFITDTNREFLLSVLERTGKEFKLFNVENGQIREN